MICSYSKDTGKQVRDAFFDAGYTMDNWEKAARKALKSSKWGREKIAHGFGSEGTSGKRGGTDEEVQECAAYLIKWAGKNPAKKKEKKTKGVSGSWKKDNSEDKKKDGGNDKGGSGSSKNQNLPSWITGIPAW
ncbi:MAG TPA: hypothetical protein VF756_02400 [Thermoanaerobaculia bacterium]